MIAVNSRRLIFLLFATLAFVPCLPAADFESDFAGVIIRHCIACHNPSEARGRLDLTQRESALKGGKTGPVLVAGKPEESLLLERVAGGSMPPPKKGTR